MATQTTAEPIRKSIELACTPEHAWEVFTGRMTHWWPLDKFSLAHAKGVQVEEIVFEPRVGGRVIERMSDGAEGEWAIIRAWDPPRQLIMAWHPGTPGIYTEVELRFTSLANNQCRVELEHRGWEAFGDEAVRAREEYQNGWPLVWERYVGAVEGR